MISLRKHIDAFGRDKVKADESAPPQLAPSPEERKTPPPTDESAVSAYCEVLRSVGESGQRAVPGLGDELARNFEQIQASLAGLPTPDKLTASTIRVQAELSNWADRAMQHHVAQERELKEIIGVVSKASDTVAERDRKYSAQIGDLNGSLRALAKLDDVAVMRRSILDSTRALRDCIEKMVEEGKEAQQRLSGEVAEYRQRLAESEQISITDALTGLGNRRAFENQLEGRMASRQNFSLIMMDLNGFKLINDQHGHLAGDDLLRQVAGELRPHFMAGDLLSRWGGDEFAGIVAGAASVAEGRIERIRCWVLGDYKITTGTDTVRVVIDAALGMVEWDGKETQVELLARADKCLYADKNGERRQGGERRSC